MLLRYIGITNTVETMLWNLNGNMITQPSASGVSAHTVPPPSLKLYFTQKKAEENTVCDV